MSLRRGLEWLTVAGLMAVGTAAIGWWILAGVGALYAGLRPDPRSALAAAAAAFAGWGSLLALSAAQGPIGELATLLAGLFSMPGPAPILLTLAFPALLAGSAAELTRAVRAGLLSRGRRPGGEDGFVN